MKPIKIELLMESNVASVTKKASESIGKLIAMSKEFNKATGKASNQNLDELINNCKSLLEKARKEGERKATILSYERAYEKLKIQKILNERSSYKSDEAWASEYWSHVLKYMKLDEKYKRFPESHKTWADSNGEDLARIISRTEEDIISMLGDGLLKRVLSIEKNYKKRYEKIKIEYDSYKTNSFGLLSEDEEKVFKEAFELNRIKRQNALEDAYMKALVARYEYEEPKFSEKAIWGDSMISMPRQEINLNGYPDQPQEPGKPDKSDEDNRVEQEHKVAEELRKLRWKNQQEEIDQLEEGAEKRRRQIGLNYERLMTEIQAQEDKWREMQNGALAADQTETLAESRRLANQGMQKAIREVEKEEVARNRAKLNELLEQYKDFDQRRRDMETAHKADMEVLNGELARLEAEGLDTTAVKAAISAREDAYRSSISSLEGEILQASDFYDKLFGTVSDRGYKVLKDFYAQAKETLEGAKMDGDGVEISIPVKDADGKFVKKAVKITVDEYRRMLKQVQDIGKQLEKDNPFAAFRTSWSELNKAIKEGGDVAGALKELNSKGKEVKNTIRGWGESLEAAFGDNFKKSMTEILTFCDGAMDMGTGIAQIWSGDIVGGVTSALSGLSSIISLFTSWKEKMEEMRREWYIAEIETNRALRERSAAYATNRSEITSIIKDAELLNWLIEAGYAKSSSVSVWDAQSAALEEYMTNLRKESAVNDELWNKLQGSRVDYSWGNSLSGGSASWDIRGADKDMIELWYNQGKLSDEAKAYYEAWVESGKTVEDLIDRINECKASMREMVMGVSFDSFLSNSAAVLKKMRGDVSELGKFTEDTLAEAILNGFMYRDLANVLEPLYDELTDAFIDGSADASYLEQWRLRYEDVMKAAGDRLDAIAGAAGVDLDGGTGTSQTGRAGAYTAMSQDQGTKLEGIGVSIQMHTASIDEKMEDVSSRMGEAQESLRKIEGNTAKSAKMLEKIAEDIALIKRDGIKSR